MNQWVSGIDRGARTPLELVRRARLRSTCILLLASLVVLSSGTGAVQTVKAAAPPPPPPFVAPGFTQTQLAGGLTNPVVIAFAPSGDIWIGEKGGAIKVFHNGAVQPNPVITLTVDSVSELGLLGLTFDPNFSSNGLIYVSYVTAAGFSRVSRFTVVNGTASLASEKVLIQGTQKQAQFGPGNGLKVGPDGKLWWTVGDNPPAFSNAHTITNIYGKVLRFNLDGTIPPDNPFIRVPNAVPNIYAYGLRNPFRFTFLPNGKMMTADTGSSYWEEMNTVQPGGNYGWDFYEGDCFSCGSINPVYAYGHLPADGAISALAAYSGSTFPRQYNNVVFFGDYNRRDIEAVTFDPTYQTAISDDVFSNQAGTIADLEQGPDGNLYFVSIFEGKFSKIAPTGPFPPTAVATATPNGALVHSNVQFSSAGSSDPYGKPITYSWNFGDNSPPSTNPNPTHAYQANGTYTAILTVSNGATAGTATAKVVVGRTPATASITSPAANATYNGGNTIAFSGSATDPVDGSLAAGAFTWKVDFYANGVAEPSFFHENPGPFIGPLSGITGGTFQIPTDLSNAAGTFYRITMTVVNSAGIPTTVVRDIQPNLTNWAVNTNVPGAAYVVDGTWQTSPFATQDVVGVKHVLTGVPTQVIGAQRYRFFGWADGSALTDSFTNPVGSSTYTANYDPVQATLPPAWQSVDVGAPATTGGADYSPATGTFYVDGGGADIQGTTDQFHYVEQALNGDGTIIARVRYQTDAHPWTKAGIMVKQSTTGGANYAAALVTPDVSPNDPNINGVNCVFPANAPGAGCDAPLPPVTPAVGHGIRLQSSAKGAAVMTPVAGFIAPNKWLKLQRTGNVFNSYYSIDGVHWIVIGSTTVAMTNPVTVGLFVTSHNVRQYSSVAFDNVSVH